MTDDELRDKCATRQSNLDVRTVIQAEIDALGVEIGTELRARDVDRADLGEYQPKIIVADRATLDKALLVQAGVPVATIQACTKTTTVESLRVDRVKPKS